MTTTLEARMRAPSGPPILRSGHRLLFLGCAVYGALSLFAWLLAYASHLPLRASWHGHELLFGFAGAAIGGFLTAAVPKWTGSKLFSGLPAAGLFGLWLMGRVVMWADVASWLDVLFLPVLAVAVLQRLIRAKNSRNYQVVGMLLGLTGLNMAWHAGYETESLRAATFVIVALIALIGGRIIPAFTRNALNRAGKDGGVVVHSPLADRAAVPIVITTAALELFAPLSLEAGIAALIAAAVLAWRARSWGLSGALRWPIVWVMHAAWWFVPLGFALSGVVSVSGAFGVSVGIDPLSALHALTAGGIGGMILAVASRAARGHAGLPLIATKMTVLSYILVLGGALLRVIGGRAAIIPAGSAWALGWVVFACSYGPMLVRARVDGKPG